MKTHKAETHKRATHTQTQVRISTYTLRMITLTKRFSGGDVSWEICLQLELVHLWAHTELDDVQFLLCDSNLNKG
jgi:hypothetical protein